MRIPKGIAGAMKEDDTNGEDPALNSMRWGRGPVLVTATNKPLDRMMRRSQHGSMRAIFRATIGVGFLVLCTGCGELGEVTALGGVADGLRTALPQVSGDFYGSCERRAALVVRIPAVERPASLGTTLPDCAPARALGTQLAADEAALTEYLAALSRLGTGAAFTYGKAVSGDITTVNDFGVAAGANKNVAADGQKAAVTALTLTGKLADLATRHLRARDVRRIVLEANPGVQALTAALYQVGDVDYGIVLADERGVLEAYYAGPMAAAQPGERLALILVQRQFDDDVERLDRRRAAATDYGAVMQEIGTLHASLAQAARDSGGFEARVKALAPQVSQLRAAVAKLEMEVR